MALLSPALRDAVAALGAACIALAGSCSVTSLEHVKVWLHDCGDGTCDQASGSGRSSRELEAPALIDPSASRFAPHGLYTYFELEQPDGASIRVELDVPTDQVGPLTEYDASYRETDGDRVRFEASHVQGVIIPPPAPGLEEGSACGCLQGRFELRFIDPGPDRELGTADDRERDLVQGRMGAEESWCAVNAPLPRPDALQPDDLEVKAMDCPPVPAAVPARAAAPVASTPASRTTVSGSYTDVWYVDQGHNPDYAGCGTSPQEASYSESGCGSGSAAASTASDEGAGCDSGSAATSTTSDEGAGCEGDRYDDNGSCGGDRDDRDAPNCRIHRDGRLPRGRSSSAQAFMGLGLPLLLAYLSLARRARRSRRRVRSGGG